jgi:hypothetical protein
MAYVSVHIYLFVYFHIIVYQRKEMTDRKPISYCASLYVRIGHGSS